MTQDGELPTPPLPDNWQELPDHLLFLGQFRQPRRLSDLESIAHWQDALGAEPYRVVDAFVREGLLQYADYTDALETVAQALHQHTIAELRNLLDDPGLPASIPKGDLIRRYIRQNPELMNKRITEAARIQLTGHGLQVVSEAARKPGLLERSKLPPAVLIFALWALREAFGGIIGNRADEGLQALIDGVKAGLTRHPLEPELITIPAGPFRMGTSDQQVRDMRRRFDWARDFDFSDEQPQHTVRLPAFQIARYPTTNAQYAAFVQATGHKALFYWPEEGRLPGDLADHPARNVSWHDARAYAAWLRSLTGRPYRLPTEAEWEKAARGTGARIWPWGDNWVPSRCNVRDSGPETTTPVGRYSPAGDSPYGCADMAGNVWEWTSSLWGNSWTEPEYRYPYVPHDGREDLQAGEYVLRVLRGGSFSYSQRSVRCACRFWGYPNYRNDDYGFRVCVAVRQE